MIQFFTHPQHGVVAFTDRGENVHSKRVQPRDIEVLDFMLTPDQAREVQFEIAADIRLGQG